MILKMQGVAQDPRMVYMFVEFMKKGDMMGVINHFQQVPTQISKFYAAQVVLAFEYIHGKDCIYRDLKPENILIADDGYIKIADFGFVKRLFKWDRTYTFCGTPEYMAPEIIS